MPADRHPTLQVLRYRDMRTFVVARLFGVAARTGFHAAVVWHVTAATGDPIWLGVLGLVEFLPVIPGAFAGGPFADRHDRRAIIAAAQAVACLGAAGLYRFASPDAGALPLVLAAVFCIRVAWAFEFPAASALLPSLVPRELFQNAVVVNATVRNLAFAAGPVAAGFAIEAAGVGAAYAGASGLFALSIGCVLLVRRQPVEGDAPEISRPAVREGIDFVRARPAILGAMLLDMLAVVFADPTVLLAFFAEEILAVGPRGYGLLYAAMGIGTFAMAAGLLFVRRFARPGRALVAAAVVFGAAALVFGLSRSFELSVLALVVAGMADQVSQVARSTLIQLSTPDGLRGRVNAVNMVFISASNQLGGAFSGFFAAATSSVFAVVAGGAACVATAGWIGARIPALRRWRPED